MGVAMLLNVAAGVAWRAFENAARKPRSGPPGRRPGIGSRHERELDPCVGALSHCSVTPRACMAAWGIPSLHSDHDVEDG